MVLSTLLTAYSADGLHHAPATQEQRRSFHRLLLRTMGDVPLDELTPEVVRAWKLYLHGQYKPSTVHKYLGHFRAVLRFGREDGWLEHDPLKGIRWPGPGEPRTRYLTADEQQRLLVACRQSRNPLLSSVVVVALATGGRKNEVRRLQWRAVDLEMGVVRFVRTKTHRARAVPLVGEALQVVQALWAGHQEAVPWVFPSPTGRSPVAIETAWRRARAQAGLEDVRFHDLRHSFASYLAMSGASLRDIAEVLGHKNIQETMRYSHLMPSHVRGVVERMTERFLRGE